MRSSMRYILALSMVTAATAAMAQVHLPGLPLPTPPLQSVTQSIDQLGSRTLDRLSNLRHVEIARLVRTNRRTVDTDPNGEPVVRNEVLVLSPTDTAIDRDRVAGFVVDREQAIGALDIRLLVLRAPAGMSTKKALRALREIDPSGVYDYNHIYSGGGSVARDMWANTGAGGTFNDAAGENQNGGFAASKSDAVPNDGQRSASAPPSTQPAAPGSGSRIGLLDTGIDATHPVFQEAKLHTWGCGNRAVPAPHGTAVASLLMGHSDVFHGVQPDAELYAADVYCGTPTGGAVDALVAAFGWMVQQRIPVINVSLVGPKNALLEKVIADLIVGGYTIVAAVGNDGPAAPPLYPASYPNVVGVTAVDAKRRVLIEAARGPQVMFAAYGADLAAASANRGYAVVRGTSFAAPIVAALLARVIQAPDPADAANALALLSGTAIDLGPPGPDVTYGRGLVGADYHVDPPPPIRQ